MTTSIRRVGELHILVLSSPCMGWWLDDSRVTLWPNPKFLHKVISPMFVNQAINFAAFYEGQSAEPSLPYPVWDSTVRMAWQLFIHCNSYSCVSVQRHVVLKQRLAHLLTEVIHPLPWHAIPHGVLHPNGLSGVLLGTGCISSASPLLRVSVTTLSTHFPSQPQGRQFLMTLCQGGILLLNSALGGRERWNRQ